MKPFTYKMSAFVLSLLGFLFSGYLSAIRLLTDTCAFNEPCPYFLGYPACWYGFAMFSVMFVVSALALARVIWARKSAGILATVSGLGIVFAGYFTVPEIIRLFSGARDYSLGLPTCAYGLVFYVIIFAVSLFYISISKQILRVANLGDRSRLF